MSGLSMSWPQYRRGECSVGGRAVALSPMECALLTDLLIASPDGYRTPADLLDALWPDPDTQPLEWRRCLLVYVCRLRAKGVPIRHDRRLGWRIAAGDRGVPPVALALAA